MGTASLRRRWTGLLAAIAAAAALGALAPSAAGFGFITSWGGPGNGPGQFGEASDISVGPDFDVYVTDRSNDRVQVFSPLGVFKRGFPAPESFGLDVVGNEVYVTDFGGGAVEVFSTQGASLRRWGSVGTGNDVPQPRYREPWGIDVGGPGGNVYVADSVNNRIMVTSPTGGLVTAMGIGMLAGPFGVAVGSGRVGLGRHTGKNRITGLDPGGTFFRLRLRGVGQRAVQHALGRGFRPDGELFVSDRGNHRVQKLTPGGTFLGQVRHPRRRAGHSLSPEGLAVDAAGNVYVADVGNTRVSRFGDRAGLAATAASLVPSSPTTGQSATLALRVANAGPDPAARRPAGRDPGRRRGGVGRPDAGELRGRPPGHLRVRHHPGGDGGGRERDGPATAAGSPRCGPRPAADPRPDPTDDAATAVDTAAADPSIASGPRLRVAFARLRAHWVRGRSSGTLEVTLDTPRSARVEVALLRGARAKPVQRWAVALRQAGGITRRLRLGGGILPGPYTVRVRETAPPPGGALPQGTLPARLAPPPEGVVASAFISRGVGGRGVRRIVGPIPGFIFANFRFAAVPRKARLLRVDWLWSGRSGPRGQQGRAPGARPRREPTPQSTGPLPPGRYRAVMRHGRTVLAVASVTIG